MLNREEKKRILEKRLRQYFIRRQEINFIEHEIITLPTVQSCGRWLVKVDTGTHSSPTEWHVETMMRLEALKAKVEASIRNIAELDSFLETRFPELHDLFIRRYRDGETPEQTSDELHISRRTYFRQVDKLLQNAMQFYN